MKKNIVVSGINLFEGGTLSVYKDLANDFIVNKICDKYNVTFFVHSKEMFAEYQNQIEIIELPKSRNSWINRIYYEYFYFYNYSKERDIFLWISIHDMTPRVQSEHQIVYCHNATPFYKSNLKDFFLDKKFYLFCLFYKYLYKINIKSNDFVIVQQNWLAENFKKMFDISDVKVFYPKVNVALPNCDTIEKLDDSFVFIYPTFPRVFKNVELVCDAVKILNEKMDKKFSVLVTISEEQNKYSNMICEKYRDIENMYFIGKQDREVLFDIYSKSNCLLFPSKLETFGLPLIEYQTYDKLILAADLNYAHEAVNRYEKVAYFNVDDARDLADKMIMAINGNIQYDSNLNGYKNDFNSWKEVITVFEKEEINGK